MAVLEQWLLPCWADLCQYRTCFTVDIDIFVPVSSSNFTMSFAVVLGLICTCRTRVRSSRGDRMGLLPERYGSCVVPWCLYLRTIVCTDERGTFRLNQTCGGLQFIFWGLGWFLLIFQWCQAKSHWVWRQALKYIHRYTSKWLKWCQFAY